MTPPEADSRKQVPAYVALVRIVAVIGMSTALGFGIFLLLFPYWLWGTLCLLAAIPWFGLMRLVEGAGQPPEAQ